jgi:hypothetical protein
LLRIACRMRPMPAFRLPLVSTGSFVNGWAGERHQTSIVGFVHL